MVVVIVKNDSSPVGGVSGKKEGVNEKGKGLGHSMANNRKG